MIACLRARLETVEARLGRVEGRLQWRYDEPTGGASSKASQPLFDSPEIEYEAT